MWWGSQELQWPMLVILSMASPAEADPTPATAGEKKGSFGQHSVNIGPDRIQADAQSYRGSYE